MFSFRYHGKGKRDAIKYLEVFRILESKQKYLFMHVFILNSWKCF